MVAPAYTATRSKLAKQFGLGRTATTKPAEKPLAPVQKIPARHAKGSRG
jgi:predicted transcriptional regulator